MKGWSNAFDIEASAITTERLSYVSNTNGPVMRLFDILSTLFLCAGFIGLVAIFFTDITLIQTTCLFIISFIISPSDGDRFSSLIKGIAEDIAHIRANLTVISKEIKSK